MITKQRHASRPRLFLFGGLSLLFGFCSQVAYFCCYFNETLARYFLIPLLSVAFWPSFLAEWLVPQRFTREDGGPLWNKCLISLGGYLLLGILVALVHSFVLRRRRVGP